MLTISDLSFSVADSQILNGVSFRVELGERLGIIGPNGSGKTTLFNCISGFNVPSSGSIVFQGHDITALPASTRARLGIGRVFQNFGIFREMTVLENVITAIESKQGSLIFPWSRQYKKNKEIACEHLSSVQLDSRAKSKAGSLSGGQMRLLEIVRAIASGAELFLLDEPTAGVSPRMKNEIEAALCKLQELGKTVLIIEHDINFIQKLCDRILVLDSGRVVLDDTPDRVRSDKRLQDIYFGSNGTDACSDPQLSPEKTPEKVPQKVTALR